MAGILKYSNGSIIIFNSSGAWKFPCSKVEKVDKFGVTKFSYWIFLDSEKIEAEELRRKSLKWLEKFGTRLR